MKKFFKTRSFVGGLLLGIAGLVSAATFNLFSPATGILKGNSSTYVTTAAASSDVISLWTGTCNSGTVLKGDGSCAATSTGTVTSVGLTMPTGFSVANSPVTGAATLGVTTTLNGVLHGNGSGFTASNVALASEVSGLLPVANAGIGVGTLTGIAKGNGTSPFTAAASSDVIGLWTGTCNSSSFLRGDGSCNTPGGGGTVTSVAAGTGISASPSPIISSGTISLDLAAALTITGLQQYEATTGLYTVWRDAAAASNAKNVLFRSGGGGFNITSATDAAPTTAVTNVLALARTGSAWSSVSFGNGTDNPTYSFLGTGAVTIGGNTTISQASGTEPTYVAYRQTNTGGVGVGIYAFDGQNSSNAQTRYSRIQGEITTNTASSEQGKLKFSTVAAGSLGTRMQIDGGNVTINAPPSGAALTVTGLASNHTLVINGANNGYGANVIGGATTGQSYGTVITAGTNSSDSALLVRDATAATQYFHVRGDGAITMTGAPSIALPATATAGGSNICRADGTGCPASATTKHSWGSTINGAAGCTITGGSGGITSCTYNSAGNYTVNLTAAGYSARPACTANGTVSGTGTLVNTSVSSSTSVTFIFQVALTGVATDAGWNFQCTGT